MIRILFLSIQPKYAERIIAGSKTADLRKARPNVKEGDLIVLYVSSPVKKIKALATVEAITSARPEQLWQQVSHKAGVTNQEYTDYFRGKSIGHAIHLTELHLLDTPIALSKLRQYWSGFHPPQNYRYITKSDLIGLLEISQRSQNGSIDSLQLP